MFYTKSSSCGLKHAAEQDMVLYITNGAFIAAAIAEEFQVRRQRRSPNCLINMSIAKPRAGQKASDVGGGGRIVIWDGGCC
jgi:hypothetical protein